MNRLILKSIVFTISFSIVIVGFNMTYALPDKEIQTAIDRIVNISATKEGNLPIKEYENKNQLVEYEIFPSYVENATIWKNWETLEECNVELKQIIKENVKKSNLSNLSIIKSKNGEKNLIFNYKASMDIGANITIYDGKNELVNYNKYSYEIIDFYTYNTTGIRNYNYTVITIPYIHPGEGQIKLSLEH